MEIFTTNSSRLEEKETFPLYLETILLIEIIPKPCIEESFFVVMKEPFLYFNFLLYVLDAWMQKWFCVVLQQKVMLLFLSQHWVVSMQLSNKLPSKEHNSILRIKWIFSNSTFILQEMCCSWISFNFSEIKTSIKGFPVCIAEEDFERSFSKESICCVYWLLSAGCDFKAKSWFLRSWRIMFKSSMSFCFCW